MNTTNMTPRYPRRGAGSGASLTLVLAFVVTLATSACNTLRNNVDTILPQSGPALTPGCDPELLANYMTEGHGKLQDMYLREGMDASRNNQQFLRDILSKAGCTLRDFDAIFDSQDLSSCDSGDRAIAYLFGLAFATGTTFPPDPARAFKLTTVAAECRNALAQRNLSVFYHEGLGTPRDDIRSLAWCLLYNAAESHRVRDDEGKRPSYRMSCDEVGDKMTRAQRREARNLRDELYESYRSTSSDGF